MPSRASMMNSATSASRTAASVCWRIRPGQRLCILVLETGSIDHPEVEAEQLRLAFAPVAGDAGTVIDEREALAHEPVEQGGLADIGAAHDGDGRKRHGGRR